MRRVLVVATIIVALVASCLGGCRFGPRASTAGSSGGGASSKVSPPQVGTFPLLPPAPSFFQPQSAVVFDGEIASVGYLFADPFSGKFVPGIVTLIGGKNVRFEKIGSDERVVTGAAEAGRTRVVIGRSLPANNEAGHGEVPFAATSDNGGAFERHDLDKVVGGRSAELVGVASVGGTSDSNPALMAVGAVGRSSAADVGDVSATDPLVILTRDAGKTWSMSAALPLPAGVTGAEALAITHAPDGTAFPGVLVVGAGWTDTTATSAREVGIVWRTQDDGRTWTVVSDRSFSQTGRDFWPHFVAADKNTVIVAGWADSVGSINQGPSTARSEDYEWVAGSDGTWKVVTDQNLLPRTRSSVTTALIARDGGGFLWAGETYDTTAGSAFYVGGTNKGHPAVWLFSTPDGATWTRIDSAVPGIGIAGIVVGIAESGNRTAFFGVEPSSVEHAWVVDRASIK